MKLRSLLQKVLYVLSRQTLKRYHPIVIGITGSVGKTMAKEVLYAVLSKRFFVWKNAANYNNEIGVPLAILGIQPGKGKLKLIIDMLRAMWRAYGSRFAWYPKYLILELAADRPGDIAYLTALTSPTMGIVTAVGDVPVHVEHYESPEEVAREKSILVRSLPKNGLAVLNGDDPRVVVMREVTKANVVTIGFSQESTFRVSEVSFFLDKEAVGGLSFRVHKGETFIPVRLPGVIATHQIYAVLAAFAIADRLGMNLLEAVDRLEVVEHPKGRMSLLRGIHDSVLIDDSYNASPLSMRAALTTLRQYPGKRKIALLGHMAELGEYDEQEHQRADEYAKTCADVVLWCKSSSELLDSVRDLIKKGDVVLIKGSRVAKMEKIVEALAAGTGFEPVLHG